MLSKQVEEYSGVVRRRLLLALGKNLHAALLRQCLVSDTIPK